MTPEKKIQNKILEYLKSLKDRGEPIFYERRQAGGLNYKMGIPDVYFVYNGTHVEVEIKQENGSLSIMQEKFRDRCKKNNIKWICAKNVNDVKNIIGELQK